MFIGVMIFMAADPSDKIATNPEEKKASQTEKVVIEKTTLTGICLDNLLSEKFNNLLGKLNDTNSDFHPIALVILSEPKVKEGKIETIFISHETQNDFSNKRLSVFSGNADLSKKMCDLLKSL
jgi:hypothetical protein